MYFLYRETIWTKIGALGAILTKQLSEPNLTGHPRKRSTGQSSSWFNFIFCIKLNICMEKSPIVFFSEQSDQIINHGSHFNEVSSARNYFRLLFMSKVSLSFLFIISNV